MKERSGLRGFGVSRHRLVGRSIDLGAKLSVDVYIRVQYAKLTALHQVPITVIVALPSFNQKSASVSP